MSDTDFVVFVPPRPTVQFYRLRGNLANAFPTDVSASTNFGLNSVRQGLVGQPHLEVEFSRPLVDGTGVSIATTSPMTFLWAYSANDFFGYHGAANRGAVTVTPRLHWYNVVGL